MSEWQPIATAPKDGTCVDLWCVSPYDEHDRGVRLTDCAWHEGRDFDPHPHWAGWVRMLNDGNYDRIEHPPESHLGLPEWKPVRWMPLPEPPSDTEKNQVQP